MDYRWATTGPWITSRKTDTQYKYLYKEDTLYLAFQGSVSREDWKQNFSFWVRPYRNMPVTWYAHSGFVRKWKSIEDEILSLVKESENICVFGFSQGGAIAILAHESIKYNYHGKNAKTVTWGSPRVIWFWNFGTIEHRLNGIVRHERQWDVVTHLPPGVMGYRHAGDCIVEGSCCPLKIVRNHMSY